MIAARPSHARWLPCAVAARAGVMLAPGRPGEELERACAACSRIYDCLDWLIEAQAGGAPPPRFCLNAERIEAMAARA